VEVGAGVEVSTGIKNICSAVNEHEVDRMARIRKRQIFFMA